MQKEIIKRIYGCLKHTLQFIFKPATIEILLILFLIALMYIFSPFFTLLFRNLIRNFDSMLLYYTIIFAYILIVLYVLLRNISLKFCNAWWNKYIWTIHTFYIMFCILVLGTVFITTAFGKPQLDLVLRDAVNSTVAGNIICTDNGGNLLAGNDIYCETKPKLSNALLFLTFDFLNGTWMTPYGQSELNFTAPSNLRRIGFRIYGTDEYNQSRSFITSNDFHFPSQDEAEERKDKFIGFFLALLGIILFTVPAAMVNFRELSK